MILQAILVALLLVLLQLRSGAGLNAAGAAAITIFAYVVAAAGHLLAPAAGVRDADASHEWTLGLIAMSLAIYTLTLVLPLTAGGAFGVLAVVVLAAQLALRHRRAVKADRQGLIGFALAVSLAAAWCSEPASAYQALRTDGVLPLWSDYFFHGGLVSQFGDARALGRGSIYLADHPPSLYHFASYAAAAALARMLDQPGLALAGAAWLPLGFLAMLTGAHALGTRLAGAAGGIAAIAAVALIPDASNYGLRNGWFSFHWTLIAHAGATYAVGAALLSLALLARWSTAGGRAILIAAALVAVSTFLFRVHIFVLLAPAWAATALVCALPQDKRKRTAWLLLAALGIGAAAMHLAVAALENAGFWRIGSSSAIVDFLWYVHTGHEPTAYTGIYAHLTFMDEPGFLLAAGIALAFAAALGAFLVALPVTTLVARETGALKPIDAAGGYLVFTWLLLMLFAPTPWHGDPSDFIHRPFVLLYAACAIWTLCLGLRVVRRNLWTPMLALSVLAFPAIVATAGAMAQPKFRWGQYDNAIRVPPGLTQAAGFLRDNAGQRDIFAVAGLTATPNAAFDVAVELCALSGMPSYLSRPHLESIKDAARKEAVATRVAALERVAALGDYEAAMQALRGLGVQWYVLTDGKPARWDDGRKRAAFTAGTVSLYRIP
jgi:hypothetical protein